MDEIIGRFHLMWDSFPGLARLISNRHEVIAANMIARNAGFTEGVICAKVGAPETHRGCKMMKMFQDGKAQVQRLGNKIKGWEPIEGYPDLCIHWAVDIPDGD